MLRTECNNIISLCDFVNNDIISFGDDNFHLDCHDIYIEKHNLFWCDGCCEHDSNENKITNKDKKYCHPCAIKIDPCIFCYKCKKYIEGESKDILVSCDFSQPICVECVKNNWNICNSCNKSMYIKCECGRSLSFCHNNCPTREYFFNEYCEKCD